MVNYLGNQELLNRYKIGFLASRKISTLSVLPTLDWASEIARREDVAVVSGFHSRLERDVLKFLLNGKCGIIVVLARSLYKRIPDKYQTAYKTGRILLVSCERDTVLRSGVDSAMRRNTVVTDIADSIVFSSVTPESSLYPLTQSSKPVFKL